MFNQFHVYHEGTLVGQFSTEDEVIFCLESNPNFSLSYVGICYLPWNEVPSVYSAYKENGRIKLRDIRRAKKVGFSWQREGF